MRFMSLAFMAFAAWAASGGEAKAAWEYYISHPLGFSFAMPGEIAASRGTYEAPVAGMRETMVFESSEDGIGYRITAVDMIDIQNNAANLLGEAAYRFQDGKNVVMDIYARADRHFGRKLTVEPADGGRATAEYYFRNGRLLEFLVTIPPGGDYGSPNVARFIDSVSFFPDMANQDSVQLTLPD